MKRVDRNGSKPKVNGAVPENDDLLIQRKIAMRAYELHLHRGGEGGHAEEDWLQAEREILQEEHR